MPRLTAPPLAVLAALAAALVLGLPAQPAFADAVEDAIAALDSDSVYVDPAADEPIDEDRVRDAIGDQPLLIAVLDETSGDAFDSANRIGLALPGNTVAVVADGELRAGSDIVCAGVSDELAADAVDTNIDQLQANGEVTQLLVDFAASMESAPGLDDCEDSSSSSGWIWFAGIGVAGLAGIGGYVVYRKRKQEREFEGLRAQIISLYDRLAADVSNLDPGEDPVTRQAVADASERYTSTGAQLSQADTVGEYAAARRTVIEGLIAARTARVRLGLDPGPDLPPVEEPVEEQLTESRPVSVGEETHQGYPHYTPGAPNYYRGGRGIPGGWYPSRFWEGMLLGQVLSRGSGSRYGSDYDRPGAAAPRWGRSRSSRPSGSSGGGDWGSGARGGDWGGGAKRSVRRNSWGGGRGGGRRGRNSWK